MTLNTLDPVHPRFTAPRVSVATSFVFALTVSDGAAVSEPVAVNVTVLPTYAAPECDLAKAKPISVWPPNHKLVRAEIIGVSDPNNNPVSIAIIGLTQDEPTQGLGDGDTAIDAVRSGSAVLIRAERAGNGNGRVYSVEFRAANSSGSSCTVRVSVCVPKNSGAGCVDDGQNYSSEQ